MREFRPEMGVYFRASDRPTVPKARYARMNGAQSVQPQAEKRLKYAPSLHSALREAHELDNTVESILTLLYQAARGQHIAWALSEAMASIMSPRRQYSQSRLNHRQRDKLLNAIASVYLRARDTLPGHCRRSRVSAGIEALAGIVSYWAASDKERAEWHPHMYPDLVAHARILRNELHNLCLSEEIAERAEKRRSAVIKSLLLPADGAHLLN